MSKRPAWSWKDVFGAEAGAKRVTVTLDPATLRHLETIAAEAGQSVAVCAASMLRDLAADDAATHGENT